MSIKRQTKTADVIPIDQEKRLELYQSRIEEFESLVPEDLLARIRNFYTLAQMPSKVFENAKISIITDHFDTELLHPYDAVAEVLLAFFEHIKHSHNTVHRKKTNSYFTTFEYVITPGLLAKIRGRGYVSKLETASIDFYT